MAIAYDSSSTAQQGSVSSITVAHTCTGTNLLLLVGVLTNDTSDLVTGATYNGVTMTRGGGQLASGAGYFGCWYFLINPATGTHNIVVSRSTTDLIGCMGSSYTGVKQTGFPDSSASGTDAAGNFVSTTTVVGSNAWLWANVRASNGFSGVTGGTGTTGRQGVFGLAGIIADSNGTVGTGSQSLNFNANAGGDCYWMIASFLPFVAVVQNSNFMTFM